MRKGRALHRVLSGLFVSSLALLPALVVVAQDFDAVERKLGEAVADGDLTLEQARVMMEALYEVAERERYRNHDYKHAEVAGRFEHWVGETSERLWAAVEEGALTEDQAWDKWGGFKDDELGPKLREAEAEGLVRGGWVDEFRQGLELTETEMRLRFAVARGEMTEFEARERIEEMSRRLYRDRERREEREHREHRGRHDDLIEGFESLGVPSERLGDIKDALGEAGVEDEQMEGALRATLRLAHGMREDEDFEPGERMWVYLEREVGLEDDQVERVVGLAKRIASADRDRD
ncbi:MAG: hypothetical protein AAF612_11605 [Planctomycetota bacterium]